MDSSVYWYGQKSPQVEPLQTPVSSEAVIVGGGIAGLTCAQALAERGVDVALVEQAFCGAGASGKSSGFVTPDSELDLSHLVAHYGEARGQELWEFARSSSPARPERFGRSSRWSIVRTLHSAIARRCTTGRLSRRSWARASTRVASATPAPSGSMPLRTAARSATPLVHYRNLLTRSSISVEHR